jgi:hypothetical protein
MADPRDVTPAERGAALLDEKKPGWEQLIDRDRLDMSSTNTDVLGQLYGSYGAGLSQLGGSLGAYGFGAGGGTYPELTREWRQLITARLEGRPDSSAGRRSTPKPPKQRPREVCLDDDELATAVARVCRIGASEPLTESMRPILLAEIIAAMKAEKGQRS